LIGSDSRPGVRAFYDRFVPSPAAAAAVSTRKKFLQGYVGVPTDENKTTRYSAAFVDLRGDGTQEIIVYLTSKAWCGTGGCTTLILAPEGPSYRVVTRITVTRPPIRILDAKSNGRHDIGVQVRGGGTQYGFSNPVFTTATGSVFNAYIGQATYSDSGNGSYTSVTGAPAIGAIPLGDTSTYSGQLTDAFNNGDNAGTLGSIGNSLVSAMDYLNDNVTCGDLFGGGQ
jgi:hypothetical protein